MVPIIQSQTPMEVTPLQCPYCPSNLVTFFHDHSLGLVTHHYYNPAVILTPNTCSLASSHLFTSLLLAPQFQQSFASLLT